ncbi:hypothetical protein NDU88_010838 [Pleurodeles waltl]|uniref:Uncharacterized protein n=1 Tax=Pleurodeles waltl TaxID=8319 RepID=A0AAV7QX14_PLEWA|nr:hypothetical protein NDU88_010838 [Pleurodeles waltl]
MERAGVSGGHGAKSGEEAGSTDEVGRMADEEKEPEGPWKEEEGRRTADEEEKEPEGPRKQEESRKKTDTLHDRRGKKPDTPGEKEVSGRASHVPGGTWLSQWGHEAESKEKAGSKEERSGTADEEEKEPEGPWKEEDGCRTADEEEKELEGPRKQEESRRKTDTLRDRRGKKPDTPGEKGASGRASHVRGGTWLSQVRDHVYGSFYNLLGTSEGKLGCDMGNWEAHH